MTTGQERKSARMVADRLATSARAVSNRLRHSNHLLEDGGGGGVGLGTGGRVAELVESLASLCRTLPPADTSDSMLGDLEELAAIADLLLLRVRLLVQVDDALGNDKYKNEIAKIQGRLGEILPRARDLSNSLGGIAVDVVSDEDVLLGLRPRVTADTGSA